jgi:serine/threonine protein phosphatase PrpC
VNLLFLFFIKVWHGAHKFKCRGNKPTQQDDFLVLDKVLPSFANSHLYAVFDGHGTEGGKVSKFIKGEVTKSATAPDFEQQFLRSPNEYLKQSFKTWSEILNDEQAIDTYLSGTTVVVAVVWGNNLIAASVGDSRLVLGREKDGNVVPHQVTR